MSVCWCSEGFPSLGLGLTPLKGTPSPLHLLPLLEDTTIGQDIYTLGWPGRLQVCPRNWWVVRRGGSSNHSPHTFVSTGGDAGKLGDTIPGRYSFLPWQSWETIPQKKRRWIVQYWHSWGGSHLTPTSFLPMQQPNGWKWLHGNTSPSRPFRSWYLQLQWTFATSGTPEGDALPTCCENLRSTCLEAIKALVIMRGGLSCECLGCLLFSLLSL